MSLLYFNEVDPMACAVMREVHGGYVDERSVKDVEPSVAGAYTRAHFFAGAGLWEVAAHLAGWPTDRPLWTASCPCQPFSAAGRGLGFDDPRHLWPDFFRLVRACRPPTVVGEQVAGAAGYGWFDRVRADLEGEGYACRAVDIPACAVDAPHRRQRLYWVAVADAASEERGRYDDGDRSRRLGLVDEDGDVTVADAHGGGRRGRPEDPQRGALGRDAAERVDVVLEYTQDRAGRDGGKLEEEERHSCNFQSKGSVGNPVAGSNPNGSFWSGAEWLACADGKSRRAKPGVRLLVDGVAGRVHLWRLAGNSIVPQVAAEVLRALIEVTQ